MKNSKKATSIIEAMIVLLIIVVGIVGLYNIFNNSQKLSNSTKNRIEAIEIAREGIEAMKNIRDTNWLKYSGDIENCFKTLNYDPACIGGGTYNKIENNKSYIIYQGNDYKWYLQEKTSGNFTNSTYRDNFRIYKKDGFYTQTGSSNPTIFTRKIKILNATNTGILLNSIVQWADSSKKGVHKVELSDLITNYK